MKKALLLMLLVVSALGCGGCAMLSADDRDFYGRGWINPKELDDHGVRITAHPGTAGGFGKEPAVDPGWQPRESPQL